MRDILVEVYFSFVFRFLGANGILLGGLEDARVMVMCVKIGPISLCASYALLMVKRLLFGRDAGGENQVTGCICVGLYLCMHCASCRGYLRPVSSNFYLTHPINLLLLVPLGIGISSFSHVCDEYIVPVFAPQRYLTCILFYAVDSFTETFIIVSKPLTHQALAIYLLQDP